MRIKPVKKLSLDITEAIKANRADGAANQQNLANTNVSVSAYPGTFANATASDVDDKLKALNPIGIDSLKFQ